MDDVDKWLAPQRLNALHILSELRRNPSLTLRRLTGDARTTIPHAKRHIGRALFQKRGRYYAKASDRLRRDLYLIDWHGELDVVTHSSRTSSLISEYHKAVKQLVRKGDDSLLRKFDGRSVTIGGRKIAFFTDRDRLQQLYRAGALTIEAIYTTGGL